MTFGGVSGRVSVLRDDLRTQLWPVPTAGIVVAIILGVGLPQLDARVDDSLPPTLRTYLFGGGADAARTVLNAIGSSLITVTSLTFSLTVVTLQLASSQFSPRLLRTFSRDRFVHLTLALFLTTFTYSLVALRTVRTSSDTQADFVPQITVTFAVILTVASVLGLVLFLAHLASQIRLETILDNVHEEATETLQRVLDERDDAAQVAARAAHRPPDVHMIEASRSGFLVSADEDALLEAACEGGVVVHIEAFPGASLVAGTPLGGSWPIDGDAPTPEAWERSSTRIADAVGAGPERTAAQDIAYGLRQMTDVAVKALSPGINDPTSAVHALGHISGLLCEMVTFELGPKLLRDDEGRVRVILDRPQLADLLDSGIAQIRHYGRDAPSVLARLFQLLREVGWRVGTEADRRAVRDQLRRLRETVAEQDLGQTEVASLDALAARVEEALEGRW